MAAPDQPHGQGAEAPGRRGALELPRPHRHSQEQGKLLDSPYSTSQNSAAACRSHLILLASDSRSQRLPKHMPCDGLRCYLSGPQSNSKAGCFSVSASQPTRMIMLQEHAMYEQD